MAKQPRGRHTQGAVREKRINAAARATSSPTSESHPRHSSGSSARESIAGAPAQDFRTHAGSTASGGMARRSAGKHARRDPGIGDVIEREPRVGESSVAARLQMRQIPDPDETVRLPRVLAEQRVIIETGDGQPADAPGPRRDSVFGRFLLLFSFVIIGACWGAYATLVGASEVSCGVTGVIRMLFVALRETGSGLALGIDGALFAGVIAYAACDAVFSYALHYMRRTRMPWGVLLPCLAFYCLFPLWGPFGDFGAVLCAASAVLLFASATKVLADGRSLGSWALFGIAGLVTCFASDIGVSIAIGVLVVVFLWLLSRCGQSRKRPEQLQRSDGTVWRARDVDDERDRAREQARARRIAPQKAIRRALAVAAVIALVCLAVPDAFMPIAGTGSNAWENDARALLALVPFAAWYIAGGVMLHHVSWGQESDTSN